MPRQQTARAFHLPAGEAAAADERVDHDADYRVLDLAPGAPPREIADRARLLLAAFDADLAPPGLRAQTLARSLIVERAAASLTDYWKNHGAPPPRNPTQIALSDRFLATLSDALGTNDIEVKEAPPPVTPPTALPQTPRVTAEQFGPLGAVSRLRAIAAAESRSGAPRHDAPRPTIADNHRPVPGRRPGPTGRSVLVKVALVGLVATAAIRVLQYRAEHPELAAPGQSPPAISTALPGEPPVRWSGLAAPQQPTGAAAPAVGGRSR